MLGRDARLSYLFTICLFHLLSVRVIVSSVTPSVSSDSINAIISSLWLRLGVLKGVLFRLVGEVGYYPVLPIVRRRGFVRRMISGCVGAHIFPSNLISDIIFMLNGLGDVCVSLVI